MATFQLILIFSLSLINISYSLSCSANKYCMCASYPEDNKYECGSGYKNDVVLDVSLKYVQMQCMPSMAIENYDRLPRLTLNSTERVVIRECPLNENTTFSTIFNILNLPEIKIIRYQTYGIVPAIHWTREYFKGLDSLTELFITNNWDKIKFDDDAFADLENLTYLNLYENNIRLTANTFQFNQNLTFLELGNNGIPELPDGAFNNLPKLHTLNLRFNNLTYLKPDVFDKLSSLVVLDLSSNNLMELPFNIFGKLSKLRDINLIENRFKSFPTELFQHNKNLSSISISQNSEYLKLDSGLFSNLLNLSTVNIDNSNVLDVAEDLFWGSKAIKNISMCANWLEDLPELLFRDAINLYSLDLSMNRIRTLPDNLFKSTTDLTNLDLAGNELTVIQGTIFQNLVNLKELNLENNNIHFVANNIFLRSTQIRKINLSNNNIKFTYKDQTPFGNLVRLETLNLANNSIHQIATDWRISLLALQNLNLSHNKIESVNYMGSLQFLAKSVTVDLRWNVIEHISMSQAESTISEQRNQDAMSGSKYANKILLSGNPVECDCMIYDLLRYLEDKMNPAIRASVEIDTKDLICNGPVNLNGTRVASVRSDRVSCPYLRDCPENCTCSIKFSDKSLTVNCSNKNLTEIPFKLPHTRAFPHIILDVSNNRIQNLDNDTNGSDENGTRYGIKELLLENNNIAQISWLPPNLTTLRLHQNILKTVNISLIQSLKHLTQITLYDNPWECSCANLDLLRFIQDDYKKFPNAANISCEDRLFFSTMTSDELCPFPLTAIVSLSAFFVLFSSLMTVIFIVYYRNENEIKVWLFAHRLCLWCVSEYELDKDKKYDAFVSYSALDREFVVKQLLPNLEGGENPFKLCLHERDWLAGELIPVQIAKSVLDSKRTIVLLSANFLTSVWGKMEFRSAHKTALQDGAARVIVIKHGDIGPYENLDPELRAYLTMNTYIDSHDKNFWNKLRYALPHPPPLSRRAALISQHIKQSLGDRMELVHPVSTQPNATTPPAVGFNKNPFKDEKSNPLSIQITIGDNKIIV